MSGAIARTFANSVHSAGNLWSSGNVRFGIPPNCKSGYGTSCNPTPLCPGDEHEDPQPLGLVRQRLILEALDSCSIITAPANKLLLQIHHRCPVILPPEQYAQWLDPANQNTATLKQLLLPPPDDSAFVMHEVSPYVSNARNEGEKCIERPTEERGLF